MGGRGLANRGSSLKLGVDVGVVAVDAAAVALGGERRGRSAVCAASDASASLREE